MANKRWDAAIEAATSGMSVVGARERNRHARAFERWCDEQGMEPGDASRSCVDAYLESVPGTDPQRKSKVRCALRAIMREFDTEHAARALGLGRQTILLDELPESMAPMVDELLRCQPKRPGPVASALTRILAWCREVDADPRSLTPTDLPQIRRWLTEVHTTVGETMVVAGDLVEMLHADRARIGTGARPVAVALKAPLPPFSEAAAFRGRFWE